MIIVQRKVGKVENTLIGRALILVTKYYVVLEYKEEDENEPIVFLQRPKKTKKKMFQIPSIPSIGVNLLTSSL
jgi:hypothetical protein